MKLPYTEGTVFLVPLRNAGYARGVVARAGRRGGLFGYFFGPPLESSKSATLDDLDPGTSVLKVRFGDLGLINGEWLILGKMANWKRADWPMPEFVRRELRSGRAWIVRRSDADPGRIESERPTDSDSQLQNDALSGYGAVEIKLTKLMS
jgi:hypothetical protein